MIHVIDHRDSFTWNIVHLLEAHEPVRVVDYTEVADFKPTINEICVLSPGPGSPEDYPQTLDWYQALPREQPLLGICLGFQTMLYAEGTRIIRQSKVLHGVQSELAFDPQSVLYAGLTTPVHVGRYHALKAETASIQPHWKVSARDPEDGTPLSIEHLTLLRFGVQYHPDSFLTEHGARIIANVYRELEQRARTRCL